MTILDSNIWIALLNEDDSQNARAQEVVGKIRGAIILPEYAVIEIATIILQKVGKARLDRFLDQIDNTPDLYVLPSDPAFFYSVRRQLRLSGERSLSFIDTALLLLSKSYTVVTFDRDLAKAIKNQHP